MSEEIQETIETMQAFLASFQEVPDAYKNIVLEEIFKLIMNSNGNKL